MGIYYAGNEYNNLYLNNHQIQEGWLGGHRFYTALEGVIAPTATITPVGTIREGGSQDFMVILSGGRYDTAEYSWSTNRGTITGSGATATIQYSAPFVSGDVRDVEMRVNVTVRGTGVTARRGTSATTSDTEDYNIGNVYPRPPTPTGFELRQINFREGDGSISMNAQYSYVRPSGSGAGHQIEVQYRGRTHRSLFHFDSQRVGESDWKYFASTDRDRAGRLALEIGPSRTLGSYQTGQTARVRVRVSGQGLLGLANDQTSLWTDWKEVTL